MNRSILDVSPGELRVRLAQKLAASGGVLLLVPAPKTSQRCSRMECGHIEAGNRPTRNLFHCLKCGFDADADENAAINIRDRAKGLWGDATRIEIAASTPLLLAQQAKPRRSFKKKKKQVNVELNVEAQGAGVRDKELAAGGLSASACRANGLRHVQGRKWMAQAIK